MKKKINSLDIDEDLKNSLKKLLIEESDSEKENFELSVITEINSEKDEDEDQETNTNSEGHNDDSDNCEGNCDYYKALCKANGLFVLTKEENFILDLIDKISDPEEKKELLKQYLESYKIKEKDRGLKLKGPETYNLKDILNRVKTSNVSKSSVNSESTIPELRHEVKILKEELQELKLRISLLETKAENDNSDSDNEITTIDLLQPEELNSLTFVNMKDRVITHKWHTKITIVVHKEYYFNAIAMIDSGADRNCINEELVPSSVFQNDVINASINIYIDTFSKAVGCCISVLKSLNTYCLMSTYLF
ncbi:hypothetical protein DH2020_007748 [Rehmannia glutinosa]|uniref:Peptidase A2 domain-containing protein n=1 Tax=Rehmannia glutinosa TaxID=99300 RepID=A0ABR0TZ14_REHGL